MDELDNKKLYKAIQKLKKEDMEILTLWAIERYSVTEIAKMQKEDAITSMYSEYDEQFVAVAILLLIVLVLEVCIMEKKNPLLSKFKLFR